MKTLNFNSLVFIAYIGLFLSGCSNGEQQGTSSGGGGFVDTSARVYLDLAKFSLAEIINNSSDQIYQNFPQDKGKDWLVAKIKKIEIRTVDEKRYGRVLKFNYDKKTETVYATNAYIQAVVDQRPWILNAKSKMEVLINLQLDLLHEVSHFYGIGITAESDVESDAWARKLLLEHIGTEKVSCINKDETVLNDEKVLARVVVLNPSTGFTYHGRISHQNQWEDYEKEYKSPFLSLIVPAGMQYEADNGDFMYQYITMVNLALKHTKVDNLQGVVSDLEDLKSEAVVNLITMWDTISDWNLLPIGHITEVSDDRMSFVAYDQLEYGSQKFDSTGEVLEESGYIYNEEYSFEINLKTNKSQFKIELLPTDKSAEDYLKQNNDIRSQTLDFDCEYFVRKMEF